MTMTPEEIIRQNYSNIGKIMTPKKRAACMINVVKAQAARRKKLKLARKAKAAA
jgi:hypothetical protein